MSTDTRQTLDFSGETVSDFFTSFSASAMAHATSSKLHWIHLRLWGSRGAMWRGPLWPCIYCAKSCDCVDSYIHLHEFPCTTE
jgi:hypothetical protein